MNPVTPLRIIDASDRRALDPLLTRGRRVDRAFDRRVRAIVDRVRDDGDAALERFARRFDGLTGSLEVSADEIRDGAARVAPDVRRAIRQRRTPHRASGPETAAQDVDDHGGARCDGRAAGRAAGARRLLRAGRPVPSSLVAADDGDSGARRGRRRRGCRVSAAGTGRPGRGARSRRQPAVSNRRRARDRGPRLRHGEPSRASTRSSVRATASSPRRRPTSRPIARSTSMPVQAKSSSSPAKAGRSGLPRI